MLRLITLTISLLSTIPLSGQQIKIVNELESKKSTYEKIAFKIWEWAELGYQEEKSSALLKKTLRPEFLNRIDETIMFTPLSLGEISQIVKILFKEIQDRLADQNVYLEATDFAFEELARLGYDPQFGARPLKRVMQKEVLNELSKLILKQEIRPGSRITLDFFDGDKFVFRPSDSKVKVDDIINLDEISKEQSEK